MSDKNEMSKQRTRWSEDRTIMSNERTFSSWIGTGLGSIGVAIGLKAVFGAFEPTWAAKAVASLFILAAIAMFWAARHKAIKTYQRLHENDLEALPRQQYTLLCVIMTIAATGTGAILWAL